MNKRGLSDVITTVLIILLVLAAVIIIWVFVAPALRDAGSQVDSGTLTSNFEIRKDSVILEESDAKKEINLTIKRNTGEGNVVALVVILEDVNKDQKPYRFNFTDFNELETRKVGIDFSGSGLGSLAKVHVVPIIENEGKELTGPVKDTYRIRGSEDGDTGDEGSTECISDCSIVGTSCVGNAVQTCANVNGCLKITSTVSCGGEICQSGICVPDVPVCNYVLNPSARSLSMNGGSEKFDVNVSDVRCTWTATSNAEWITITSGASGTGNGTISYTGAANLGIDRIGTITVNGQTHTISQSGEYSISLTGGTELTLPGNGYAYVTRQSGGARMTTIDLATRQIVNDISIGGSANKIVSSNTHLYTTNGTSLNIYSIANPAAPFLVSSLSLSYLQDDVILIGNYVFVEWKNGAPFGAYTIDVSNPGSPLHTGTTQWADNNAPQSMTVRADGQRVYLASGGFSGTGAISVIRDNNGDYGQRDPGGISGGVALLATSQNMLYTSQYSPGDTRIRIYNIAGSPQWLGEVASLPGRTHGYSDISLSGNFLYTIGRHDPGFILDKFDVNNPSAPVFVSGRAPFGANPHGVVAASDGVYLVTDTTFEKRSL